MLFLRAWYRSGPSLRVVSVVVLRSLYTGPGNMSDLQTQPLAHEEAGCEDGCPAPQKAKLSRVESS